MFKLIIEDDEGHTTVVPLQKDEITIGRKEGNTIRLTERNVSRHHARLIRANGSVFIEDLDSYNGIKVNGERITARTNVRVGDLIEIGDYHLALQEAALADARGRAEPPVRPQGPPSIPQTTVPDGGTAILRLPVEEKRPSEPGQVRPIPANQAGQLLIETTDLSGQVFTLDRTEMTIGRIEGNDIVLPHRSVSSNHAKIVFDGGIYRVIDMDSANGVLVNGEEYARVDIRRGDVIELGHVKLRYLAPGEEGARAAEQPGAPASRRMVDASIREAELTKAPSISLKTLVMIGGGVAAVALIAFLVVQFTKEKPPVEPPPKDDVVVAPVPDIEKPKPPPVPAEDPTKAAAAKKTEATELYKEGLHEMKNGRWDAAIEKISLATGLDPSNNGAKVMLEKARKEKRYASLLAEAQTAISAKDWEAAIGKLNEIQDDTSLLFKEREKLYPGVKKNYNAFHLNAAQKLADSGKLAEALKHLDSVLSVDENNQIAQSRKQELQAKLQKIKKPRPPKPQPVNKEANKQKANELRTEGIMVQKKGQFAKAISLYERALKLNPKDYDLYRFIGAAYAQKGDRAKAYAYYKKYVDKCPKCPYAPPIRNILKDYEDWTK
ncbi:MAG: FHA domain-containing protein [Deltaproteobacteria bacterium]|nr:FHA domain-containing protein [Deltaproteobacteria bacterium]